MGEGNRFLALRGSMLDAQGHVRTDIYKPRGDIHLNASGTQIISLRIQRMLEVMLPNIVPVQTPPAPVQAPAPVQTQTAPAKPQQTRVQAPVVVNMPSVVGAPLVAIVNGPAVINAPVVVQHVAVVDQEQVETPMETDEDELLAKLFFKKYGRALPEKEKENDVDNIKFIIDLTDESDEMEVAAPVVVVKTEPIEAPETVANVTNVAKLRQECRELVKGCKALIAFGKTLRKSNVIPEKEEPEVSADSKVSADTSINPIESVNPIETEQIIAESDAAIKASREFTAEFGDTPLDEFDDESEFRLYRSEDDVIEDDDDAMIDDV